MARALTPQTRLLDPAEGRDLGRNEAGVHPDPHPEIVAACEDLDVLGVVFYLMEEVDGFNPGNEIAQAYVNERSSFGQVLIVDAVGSA